MMPRIIFFISTMLIYAAGAISQPYPQNDFIPPLDIPLKLSGTFGELRAGHFHSGIDLKTGEMEGLKVYSIADGYVSRIKVQAGGYGKALYITHPNGFVSVYAHLSKYNDAIDAFVNRSQYDRQSYEIDLYPPADLFPVDQGTVVAYSGNTGRSGGPHLHFEIRGEASQKPINPLYFNYTVWDNTLPLINVVKIYPLGRQSRVENSKKAGDFYTVLNGGSYSLKGSDTISAAGTIYFGINTYDPFNGGMNKNGVYSIRLFVDDELFYGHQLESFSFDETRYINSLIDYREYKTLGRRVQKSFVEPNNRLGIYTKENNTGLRLEDGRKYQVRYEVADLAGNTARLVFWVKGGPLPGQEKSVKKDEEGNLFTYRHDNTFKTSDLNLVIPGKALYDTLGFFYEELDPQPGMYSGIHRLHVDEVPLHSWCTMSIRTNGLEADLSGKALIVKIGKDQEFEPWGGEMKDGWIETSFREFGDYCVVVDTIPPEIKPLNIKNNKSLLAQTTIQAVITDALSGISSYNAYLNGVWVLMEYDEKNDLLTYHFDHNLKDGENAFELIVTDERNNRAEYKATLLY